MTALTYHGGRTDHAASLYPDAPRPWLDLSTGINPVPWRPPAALAIDWGPLPSPTALAGLETAAAGFFGVTAETVVAVPGSEIALRLLGQCDLPAPFRYVAPSYRTHAHAFPDAMPVAIGDAASAPGTLLLANPNNPDGRLLDRSALLSLAADRWLVVDEAFADIDGEASVAPVRPDRTVILRSFGKFFGLAGVRLGFVIGPPAIVARFRTLLGDWPVSAAAIAFGTVAYRDTAWIAATRARLHDDARTLDRVLHRHGLHPHGDCPLFRLVRCDRAMFGRLGHAGILTRPFDAWPDRLRIGLPADATALDRLDRALADG